MFATFRNAVLLGSVLALPMIGVVSTSARATAVASASASISDFDLIRTNNSQVHQFLLLLT